MYKDNKTVLVWKEFTFSEKGENMHTNNELSLEKGENIKNNQKALPPKTSG